MYINLQIVPYLSPYSSYTVARRSLNITTSSSTFKGEILFEIAIKAMCNIFALFVQHTKQFFFLILFAEHQSWSATIFRSSSILCSPSMGSPARSQTANEHTSTPSWRRASPTPHPLIILLHHHGQSQDCFLLLEDQWWVRIDLLCHFLCYLIVQLLVTAI